MKDYSCDNEFKQKRNAIHADFIHIKNSLVISKELEEASKAIREGGIFKSRSHEEFFSLMKYSLDQVIITHLCNLIGTTKNDKHNLCAYIEEVKENIEDYVKTHLQERIIEGFDDPNTEVKVNILCFEKYLVSINNGNNCFYDRLKCWRDKIFNHLDQDINVDRFMPPVEQLQSNDWKENNKILYSEIDEVYNKLWKYFHSIDRTKLTLDYSLQPVAFDIVKYLMKNNEKQN